MNTAKKRTLGTVATYINGRAFKPSEWKTSGKPIIRIQNLTDSTAKYNFSDVEHEEKFLVTRGDLLFAWSASLGAHIWSGQDAWLNQHIFKVIPNDDVAKNYLYYFLLHVVAELYSKTHGSGMVHITKGPFLATEIPVPPLPEQERIVAKIEELFSQLDAAVAELKSVKAKLAIYRQSVLKEAFGAFDNTEEIKNVSQFVTSGSRGWAQYYNNEGAKFIRIGNLTRTTIDIGLDDVQHVSLPPNAEGIRSLLFANDVLVSITADLGSIGLVPNNLGEAYINQHIAMIRFKNPVLSKFYAWYLRSDHGQKQLLKNRRGNGKQGLGLDDIRNTKVPVISEQQADTVVNNIEERLSLCGSIEQTVDTALQQAAALRQSILKQAFEGNL